MLRDHDKQLRKLENLFLAGRECSKTGRDRKRQAEIAKRFGLTPKMLTLAKQFASQYTKGEFVELIGLRKPNGKPFDINYVPWLLRLPWRTKSLRRRRSEYQREIAESAWTVRKLRNFFRWIDDL